MLLIAIDASGYIHRAYNTVAKLQRSDGQETGAVYGFCKMLWYGARRARGASHVIVVFDAPGKKWRHQLYDNYKANRPPLPDSFTSQFPLIREAVDAFSLARIEMKSFEADDVIATIAYQFASCGGEAIIMSSDKDFYQLLRFQGIQQFDPIRKKFIEREDVIAKFGVGPELAVDAQALIGDSTDNIPGVPGIGAKMAGHLLNRFGSLESVLMNVDLIPRQSVRETLRLSVDKALLSRDLVTLSRHVPGINIDEYKLQPLDRERLTRFLEKMEFVSLRQEIEGASLAA